MNEIRTVADLVTAGEAGRPAIRAPERAPLTYAALRALTERTVAALNRVGVGRDDRVAIVLPNGPEMASAFLAIGSGATTAPLNPAYKAEEFAFYLSDLGAKALLVDADGNPAAEQVAADLGIGVLPLQAVAPQLAHLPLKAVALTDPWARRTHRIAVRSDVPPSPAAQTLIQALLS